MDSKASFPGDGIAVVTGAGAGLGRALAVELTKRGIEVAGLARRAETLEETAALIPSGLFSGHATDVSDREAVRSTFKAIRDAGKRPAILINNAAVYPHFDFLTEDSPALMDVVGINLGGMVNCSYFALQHMVESGVGRIVNVTSFADRAPLSGSSAYSISKGAGRIFTKALIADLHDRFPDIVVSDWSPGALATQMGIPQGIKPEDSAKWGAELALWHDRSLTGALFERNRELLPPISSKRRLKNLLLLKPRRTPRMLVPGAV